MKRIAVYYHLRFGGAKRVVQEQVKGLVAKGYSVDVYTLNKDDDVFSPELYATASYSYDFRETISSIPFLGRIINDAQVFFGLKKLHQQIATDIDTRNYDIVITHPDRLTQAPYMTRYLKTPSAYYCQEPLRIVYEYSLRFQDNVSFLNRGYEELTRFIRKQIDRTNVRAATHTIASCYHIRERMIEVYDVYPIVVYAGIDTSIFRPKKVKKKNEVVFVGSPDVVTDGYDLAAAALLLIPKVKRPQLKVISWKKENKKRLTEEELIIIYNQAVATFCLSRLETFGLVPLESMACGIPVLATNVSGHRETVADKKAGFLVEFSPQEIADRLLYIIEHPQEARKMGEKAREHTVTVWDWKKRIVDLEKGLQQLLKTP